MCISVSQYHALLIEESQKPKGDLVAFPHFRIVTGIDHIGLGALTVALLRVTYAETQIPVDPKDLLMAVLEKRLGLSMGVYDAYVNLAGGMKIAEPSLDLGICLALISSFRNKPIDSDVIAFGEVGLSGEVRSVSMADLRVQEAEKLGFKKCIVPKALLPKLKKSCPGLELIGAASVSDAMKLI